MKIPPPLVLMFICANAGTFSVAELNSFKQTNDIKPPQQGGIRGR